MTARAITRAVPLGAFAALYAAAVALTVQDTYALAAGVTVAHVLVAITAAMLVRLLRHAPSWERRLVVAALAAKFFGTVVRYRVVFDVYGGVSDARGYHEAGLQLARSFRSGEFDVTEGGTVVGTRFVEVLTGGLYAITGPTMIGAFLVFSWVGFWGLFLLWRAFVIAVPAGNHQRYGLLLFFLPSLVFWPSSLGKDSWMAFGLGLCAYGAARITAGQSVGFFSFTAGVVASALVRPHVALAVVASLVVAVLASRRTRRPGEDRTRATALVVGVVAAALVLSQVQAYFNLDRVDASSVEGLLDYTEQQTSQGGSEFEATGARSPLDIPGAVVSVLFRPFPWEATNPMVLASSLEGVLLLYFLVRFRREIVAAIRQWRSHPYVAFLLSYGVIFCIAFSSFGNFGILARQRVQLLPFALMIFALRPASEELDVAEREGELVQ